MVRVVSAVRQVFSLSMQHCARGAIISCTFPLKSFLVMHQARRSRKRKQILICVRRTIALRLCHRHRHVQKRGAVAPHERNFLLVPNHVVMLGLRFVRLRPASLLLPRDFRSCIWLGPSVRQFCFFSFFAVAVTCSVQMLYKFLAPTCHEGLFPGFIMLARQSTANGTYPHNFHNVGLPPGVWEHYLHCLWLLPRRRSSSCPMSARTSSISMASSSWRKCSRVCH